MSLQKSLRLILLGVALLIWLLAQDLAFAMGRGGDGWDGPFFLSLVLIVSYPVALFITFLPTSQLLVKLNVIVALMAAALDLFLLVDILGEQDQFLWVLRHGAVFAVSWGVLWLGWQLLSIASLLRTRRLLRDCFH